jgi:multidrug efflux pump subunit AcrB
VSNIEHIESQSLRGLAVIKIYFQPGSDVTSAVAEVTAVNQTLIKILPPGITPPLILRYNAADVPVIQVSMSSKTLSQQEITDLGNNFIRSQLVPVRGAAVSVPAGG